MALLKGFDPKYRDFPDYILGVTREVWEGRGVGTLRSFYAPDIVVRSPASVVVGNEQVIAATMATLAEFPDRELLGEDVVWCGTPDEGLLSSHRILSTATHAGDGAYGKASGRRSGTASSRTATPATTGSTTSGLSATKGRSFASSDGNRPATRVT